MSRLIRRIDGKTGKAELHTLHEWNVINGYEKPDEIIDGEVVEEVKQREVSIASPRTPNLRAFALSKWRHQEAAKPATNRATGGTSGNEPTSPTMHEPG